VVQIASKVVPPAQPADEVELVAAPAVEVAWEQLEVMPALAPEAPKVVARQPGKLKRRHLYTEDELREQLARAPEVGLTRGNLKTMADTYEATAFMGAIDNQPGVLLQVRPDMARLPMRPSTAMQNDAASAAILGVLSKKLHAYVDGATPKDAHGERIDPVLLRQILREERYGKRKEWLRPEAVPVLRQLLSHEQTPIRALLVELLGEISGQKASELLAERAVFDLTPEVRAAAVEALRPRPREQFRHVFLTAMRFPWPPAADHAAEALAALEDHEALPHLVAMLDQPDPAAPYAGSRGGQLQHQLVRVNHLANCFLCHPPAQTMREPVLGIVPGLSRRGVGGWGGGSSASRHPAPWWVRADVTFFRQDFSESLSYGLAQRSVRPTVRFDFMVRTRSIPAKEAKRLQEWYDGPPNYEQRDAVLFACRELTGKDLGTRTEDWLKLYPTAQVDAEAARLTDKLVKAAPGQRDPVLAQLREAKGEAATQALARAIPKLPEAERAKAREALVKRLTRITADALRDKLHDAEAEIRRAAAACCAQREDSALVAELIPLLGDAHQPVSAAAQASLKTLTGQNLGDSAQAWEEWLNSGGER
ncbi:MAG TPA: HEAT repeat domain-containing protein, partial [Gemmataceae bacterium]|nr:HEAT repeat domain-containing protein [Gemmataceae bacterium]